MLQILVTEQWHQTFPQGHIGILLIGNVDNSQPSAALDHQKRAVESTLREKFNGFKRPDFMEVEILKAYRNYYKKFKKTYHVQLQLESVVLKGKSLPNVTPLVDANFTAELETLVLTAGHDADLLESPVTIDASKGGESFIQLTGQAKSLKANDMIMTDKSGVKCTIIYGQDQKTPISARTRRALYVSYAPQGVLKIDVQNQLRAIEHNIRLFSPGAEVEMMDIFSAGDPK